MKSLILVLSLWVCFTARSQVLPAPSFDPYLPDYSAVSVWGSDVAVSTKAAFDSAVAVAQSNETQSHRITVTADWIDATTIYLGDWESNGELLHIVFSEGLEFGGRWTFNGTEGVVLSGGAVFAADGTGAQTSTESIRVMGTTQLLVDGLRFGRNHLPGDVTAYALGINSLSQDATLSVVHCEFNGLVEALSLRAGWFYVAENYFADIIDDVMAVQCYTSPAYIYLARNALANMTNDPAYAAFHPDFLQTGGPSDSAGGSYTVQVYANIGLADAGDAYGTQGFFQGDNKSDVVYVSDFRYNIVNINSYRGISVAPGVAQIISHNIITRVPTGSPSTAISQDSFPGIYIHGSTHPTGAVLVDSNIYHHIEDVSGGSITITETNQIELDYRSGTLIADPDSPRVVFPGSSARVDDTGADTGEIIETAPVVANLQDARDWVSTARQPVGGWSAFWGDEIGDPAFWGDDFVPAESGLLRTDGTGRMSWSIGSSGGMRFSFNGPIQVPSFGALVVDDLPLTQGDTAPSSAVDTGSVTWASDGVTLGASASNVSTIRIPSMDTFSLYFEFEQSTSLTGVPVLARLKDGKGGDQMTIRLQTDGDFEIQDPDGLVETSGFTDTQPVSAGTVNRLWVEATQEGALTLTHETGSTAKGTVDLTVPAVSWYNQIEEIELIGNAGGALRIDLLELQRGTSGVNADD